MQLLQLNLIVKIESQNTGDKKPDPEGITYIHGDWGKKIYDPAGVEHAPLYIFEEIVSRWDKFGAEIRGWMIPKYGG